jgi:leucyl aminopeptidase
MIEFVAGGPLEEVEAAAVAVPVLEGRQWGPGAAAIAGRLGEGLDGYLDIQDFTGKAGQIAPVPGGGAVPFTTVYFVGLGKDPDGAALRKAAGDLGRAASRTTSLATTLHQVEVPGAVDAVATGFVLGQYRFDKYRSEPKPSRTERVVLIDANDAAADAAARASLVAAAVTTARDLINEPPVNKPAAEIADRAAALAGEVGLRVVVHERAALEEGGFGGLLGVAAGAHNPPRLVEIWHEPEDPRAFLALVGKGIVFDSGGLSIKPANAMETMKTDMSGAAAVIAALWAIARLGLPVKVVGVTPLTENMPGGAALRPGDVLTARNGKTIEVLNTDAEGRLVLADGLSLATEWEPDLVVDLATLTGACHVALGDEIAGVWGNDDDAVQKVLAAAARGGERAWHMPLPADYRKMLDSQVADMKNVGDRYGGAITAALFLQEFVGDTPWVHMDIAGPARATKDAGHLSAGGTGYGVATLVALAEDLAAS